MIMLYHNLNDFKQNVRVKHVKYGKPLKVLKRFCLCLGYTPFRSIRYIFKGKRYLFILYRYKYPNATIMAQKTKKDSARKYL